MFYQSPSLIVKLSDSEFHWQPASMPSRFDSSDSFEVIKKSVLSKIILNALRMLKSAFLTKISSFFADGRLGACLK